MSDFEAELRACVLEEAKEIVQQLESSLLNLEDGEMETIEELFRSAHNLKGSSRAAGFHQMGDFCHKMENVLSKLKKNEMVPTKAIADLLLRCNDQLKAMIEVVTEETSATIDCDSLIKEIEDTLEGKQAAPSQTPSPKPSVDKSKSKTKKTPQDTSLRVSLSRLDKLIDGAGELVILNNFVKQNKDLIQSMNLQKSLDQISKIAHEIHFDSMRLRMVSIKQTFQKMNRIVRDTATALDKEVQFNTHGENTEIDKTVLEKVSDPLVHIIRNAVDHGLEATKDRMAAGKPKEGSVTLSAFHRGNQMVIEIQDDGKGLDAQKLMEKAREKGILGPDEHLPEELAFELIFAPGFSTKQEATDISGRGVGMDVVKSNIQQLQGKIQIDSKLGKGSTFRLVLPLTLSVIDGMIVKANGENFIVPLNQFHHSFRPSAEAYQIESQDPHLLHMGEKLPLYCLDAILKRKITHLDDPLCIIVRNGERPFALLVEDILEQQQVVLKQLGEELRDVRGITGGAVLPDGSIALILDLLDLIDFHQINQKPNPEINP